MANSILGSLDPSIQKYASEKFPKEVGVIYAIVQKESGKSYIGQCRNHRDGVRSRWRQHCHKSGCAAISNAISKYGQESFHFVILRVVPLKDLDSSEIECIAHWKTLSPNGYNLKKGGEGGGLPCEEAIKKMQDTKRTPEARASMSIIAKEIHSKPETKLKVRMAINKRGEEWRVNKAAGTKRMLNELRAAHEKSAMPIPQSTSELVLGSFYKDTNGVLYKASKQGKRNGKERPLRLKLYEDCIMTHKKVPMSKFERTKNMDRRLLENIENARKNAVPLPELKSELVRNKSYLDKEGKLLVAKFVGYRNGKERPLRLEEYTFESTSKRRKTV